MPQRNPNFAQLKSSYLFPEINARKNQFLAQNPRASLISLGIGDTTEPLPASISNALIAISTDLGTQKGYSGYGPEQGVAELRNKISSKIYSNRIEANDIFISDGAKCDLGRLQMLFGSQVSIAVQDPAYPVYLEGSLMQGVKHIIPMPCFPENRFFPDLKALPKIDLIYFCSPNNPTGTAATRIQLKELVDYAFSHRAIIIFDSAYAQYIQDSAYPKSIYEIEGADEIAIEIGSFSKLAGFSGIRLGWTVVPEKLRFDDGSSVKTDWKRLTTTIFNGASNIAQQGGCAILEEKGWDETNSLICFYLENARLIKNAFETLGYEVFGGVHAPYLWVKFPGRKSWDAFQILLEKYHLITTPGAGFGPAGESFLRFSAFGRRENIIEAIERLQNSSHFF